jgi:hypothetical protein
LGAMTEAIKIEQGDNQAVGLWLSPRGRCAG